MPSGGDRPFEHLTIPTSSIFGRPKERTSGTRIRTGRAVGVMKGGAQTRLIIAQLVGVIAECGLATLITSGKAQGPYATETHRDAEKATPRQPIHGLCFLTHITPQSKERDDACK